MRLLNCHIENFGKLHDFSMDFSAGCNTICQENGFGKSTLASFIRVMFYGFLGESKRNNLENERKRYQPWQGGIYGGSLSFEVGEKQYCLRRVFHDKMQNDEFELRDQKTNLISTDYTEHIGEELFGVNQESFIRTVYIGQNDMVTSATDDINAKIGNLTDDTNDLNRFEEADKKLTDYINALSPKRKTGSVYKLKEEASALHTQIRALQGIEESITQQMELMEQKRDEIAHLKEEQSAISKKQEEASKKKDIQAKKEIYEHLCQELLMKEKEVTDCEKKLHDSLPDKNVLDEMSIQQKQSEELYAKIQLTQLQENEILRLNELKNLFQNESDPKAIISEMSARWNERNTKKSTLLMKKSTLATLISSKEADKRRQTEAARKRFWQRLIVGVILLFAGIGIVGFYMAMKASFSSSGTLSTTDTSFGNAGLLITGVIMAVAGIISTLLAFLQKNRNNQSVSMPEELENLEKEIRDDEEQIQNTDTTIKTYFTDKGLAFLESDVQSELQKLLSYVVEYEQLLEKERKSSVHGAELENYDRMQEEIGAFLHQYEMDVTPADYAKSIVDLKEKVSAKKGAVDAAKKNYTECLQKKEQFEKEYPAAMLISETKDDLESLEELNRRFNQNAETLENLYQTARDYEQRLEGLREQNDSLNELEKQLANLNQTISDQKLLYDRLKYTQDFLKQAKETMTQKYVAPLKNSFLQYYEVVVPKRDKEYYMDANADITVLECGMQHETTFLSAGYQDLIGLCLRFAFADAMYPNEKPMLILDDPLANLDAEKIAGGKKLLQELSKNYQVIYFTCHDTRR